MTDLQLGRAVAPRHRRIDAASHEAIYVVGDVHGCIVELRRLWERLGPSSDDLVVFVGDLVRKGPASDDVVTFIRRRDNAISVRGNNEEKLIRGNAEVDLSPDNREAIESFPLAVSWEGAMAVHGGVHPDRPLTEHTPRDLLEMRAVPPENGYDGPFWFESYVGPPRIFFGHTVFADPFVDEWAIGLDTGCVYGGQLTAYHYNSQEYVTVEASRAYEPRKADNFIVPQEISG